MHVDSAKLRYIFVVLQYGKCLHKDVKKKELQVASLLLCECETSQEISGTDINTCIPFTYWEKTKQNKSEERSFH